MIGPVVLAACSQHTQNLYNIEIDFVKIAINLDLTSGQYRSPTTLITTLDLTRRSKNLLYGHARPHNSMHWEAPHPTHPVPRPRPPWHGGRHHGGYAGNGAAAREHVSEGTEIS